MAPSSNTAPDPLSLQVQRDEIALEQKEVSLARHQLELKKALLEQSTKDRTVVKAETTQAEAMGTRSEDSSQIDQELSGTLVESLQDAAMSSARTRELKTVRVLVVACQQRTSQSECCTLSPVRAPQTVCAYNPANGACLLQTDPRVDSSYLCL